MDNFQSCLELNGIQPLQATPVKDILGLISLAFLNNANMIKKSYKRRI